MARVDKDDMTTLRPASDSNATAASALDDIQIEAVAYAINNAANCGQYDVIFQEEMRSNTKSELTGKGYTLAAASQLDRGTVISWK